MCSSNHEPTINKILFVCGSSNQKEPYLPIVDALKDRQTHKFDIFFITLDGMTTSRFTSFSSFKNIDKNFVNVFSVQDFKYDIVNILKKVNPDIIILPNDTSIPYMTFTIAAGHLKIPTLFCQTAAIGRSPFKASKNVINSLLWALDWHNAYIVLKLYHILLRTLKQCDLSIYSRIHFILKDLSKRLTSMFMEGHGYCDKIAVINPYTKKMFIDDGVDPAKIIVTGFTKFDALFDVPLSNKKSFCRKMGLDPNKPIVSLMTNCRVEHKLWKKRQRKEFIKSILEQIAETNIQLIIKVHPNEDPTDYLDEAKNFDVVSIVSKTADIYEVMRASDIIIPDPSTTWLEAALLKKPLIFVDLFNELPESFPPVALGWPHIRNAKDIIPIMTKLMEDEDFCRSIIKKSEEYLFDYLYIQDGQASKRVADLIIQMIEESKRERNEN